MSLSKPFSIGLIAIVLLASNTELFARSDQIVIVQVGKSSVEEHSNIKVEFLEMVEDSRCPTDVTCMWAGNAKIKIRVSRNGKSKMIELNSMLKNKDNIFAGYVFTLDKLTPEPASNIRINKDGYVAGVKMDRVVKS